MKNVTVTTSVTKIAGQGTHPIVLQNQGSAGVYLQFDGSNNRGVDPTTSFGHLLSAGQSLGIDRKQFPFPIFGIASTDVIVNVQGEN